MPTTPTSLGSNVLSGTGLPNYTLQTPQYVLEDTRQSYINFHNSEAAPNNFAGPNKVGPSTSPPSIVHFNNGWLSLQETYYYGPEDIHWSPLSDAWLQLTILDANGLIVEQRRTEYTDWNVPGNGPPINPLSEFATIAPGVQPLLIAGNANNRLLYFYQTIILGVPTDVYQWADFNPSTWAFTVSPAFTTPQGKYSPTYSFPQQYKLDDGYIIQRAELTTTMTPLVLTGNLEEVTSPLAPPAAGESNTRTRRSITPSWQGNERPHFVVEDRTTSSVGTKTWYAYPIHLAGTTAFLGTVVSGTITAAIGDWSDVEWIMGEGFVEDNNWEVGNVIPKPADYWVPATGPKFVMPNDENLEWVYISGQGGGHTPTGITCSSSVVIDWYDHHTGTVYDGDHWTNQPYINRISMADWRTGGAGSYDIEFKIPRPPQTTGPSAGYYYDSDLDDPAYANINPHTNRVLYWFTNYWTWTQPTAGDHIPASADMGENTVTSYVILGPVVEPTPEAPGWVNFFNTAGVTDPDCPMLGVGSHKVFLYDRGGARMIAQITDTAQVRWSRVRDDISTASIVVNNVTPQCADVLRSIAVGRHELVIFRSGERVWEGPITLLTYTSTGVEINAEDINFYLARTIMRHAYDNRYAKKKSKVGPVTRRAQIILATELQRKERLGYNILRFLDVRTHAKTTRTSRLTYAYQSTVWEELDYMAAKLSLDYTAIGRRLLITDVHDVFGRTEMLTDKDFLNPLIISSYGKELATRSAVTDGQGHWAAVGGVDDFYGEVELLNTTYGEQVTPATPNKPTKDELKKMMEEFGSQAQRNIAGRYPIPTIVRIPDNTQLDPSAPIAISQLVPGVRVPIRSTQTIITLEQEQKLDKMNVQETPAGEIVSVTLSPAPGTTPWDDSMELPNDDEVQ